MNDTSRTKPELIKEISALKKRIQELEQSETEHKRAEEELRFSRQQLRLLIEAGPDYFFLKDLNLRYQLVNSANARFFGREEADILGRTDVELMPEGAAVACQESDRLAIREKRTVVTIEPVGDKFYETYKFPVIVADEIVGVAGIIRDITYRKQAEESLRDVQARYRLLFEHAPDGIVIVDPATAHFVEFNETAHRQLGYSREEFARLSIPDFEVVESPEETLKHIENVIREGKDDFETMHRTRQGEIRNIHVTAQMTKISGHAVYHCAWRDITERKRAEEALKRSEGRLSSIIEFLPDATFAIDLEGKIISWNRAIEEMTGFSAETMLGKGNYEYAIPFYGEKRPILVNFLFLWDDDIAKKYSFIKKDGDTLYTETDVPCVRGQSRTLWGKASPLRNEMGDVIGAIESIRDITEHKRAQEDREKLILELQEALNKVKTLSGLLPICASCKRIRNNKGYWEQIEVYVRDHSEAEFSHSICPECTERLYPEYFKKK